MPSWFPAFLADDVVAIGAIDTGANDAGNGGSGFFQGTLVDTDVTIFAPINIAVASPNSTAIANQTNLLSVDQGGTQIGGIGGDGGNGNIAGGGNFNLLTGGTSGGSNAVFLGGIQTGNNTVGNGGDGYFNGVLVDADLAVVAPVNVAIAGPNSSAVANQTNVLGIDQGATQIGGIGGDGGNGNIALGGDLGLALFDLS